VVEELDEAQQTFQIAVKAVEAPDNNHIHEVSFDVVLELQERGSLEGIARLAVVRVDANEFPPAMFHIAPNSSSLGCHLFPVMGRTAQIGDNT